MLSGEDNKTCCKGPLLPGQKVDHLHHSMDCLRLTNQSDCKEGQYTARCQAEPLPDNHKSTQDSLSTCRIGSRTTPGLQPSDPAS